MGHSKNEFKNLLLATGNDLAQLVKAILDIYKIMGFNIETDGLSVPQQERTRRRVERDLERRNPNIVIPEQTRSNLAFRLIDDPQRLRQLTNNVAWIYACIGLTPYDRNRFNTHPLECLFTHLKSPSNHIRYIPKSGSALVAELKKPNCEIKKGDIVFTKDLASQKLNNACIIDKIKQNSDGTYTIIAKHFKDGTINHNFQVDPKTVLCVFHLPQNTDPLLIT